MKRTTKGGRAMGGWARAQTYQLVPRFSFALPSLAGESRTPAAWVREKLKARKAGNERRARDIQYSLKRAGLEKGQRMGLARRAQAGSKGYRRGAVHKDHAACQQRIQAYAEATAPTSAVDVGVGDIGAARLQGVCEMRDAARAAFEGQ